MREMALYLIDIFRKSISQRIQASPEYMNFRDANPNSLEGKLRQIV